MSHSPAAMAPGLRAVAAVRLLGEVGLQALHPLFGLFGAPVIDCGREQRQIVVVLARTDADLALPLGVGEVGIGDRRVLDAVLRGIDDASALGQTEPVAFRIAVFSRQELVDGLVDQRLRDALFLGRGEAGDVDGHDHVGRRVRAFGGDTLFEALVEEQHLGLDAGLGGEGVQHRLDQLRLAIGVDVDGAVGERRGCEKRGEGKAGAGR